MRSSGGAWSPRLLVGLLALATFVLAASGCSEKREDQATQEDRLPQVEAIAGMTSPAEGEAAEPNLFAAPDGSVYLSWFERLEGDGYALRFSVMNPTRGESWSAPRTIVEGEDFFVNWADFPSMHQLADGTLAAHWLVRSGSGPVDYDVHLAWSTDGGDRWSDPVIPHRDGTESEHGFVSLFPWDAGEDGADALGAIWLDARNLELAGTEQADGPRAMSLRFTSLWPEGMGEEVLLDDYVCDCCQTSAAVTSHGPVVVYRDRTEDEIRDISIVRHVDGAWTEPAAVHDDGWEIAACPVNGPMVAASGERVAVAWFTMAGGEPMVRLAFSEDAGESFGDPIRIDDGKPVGRVAVSLLEGGEALVTWLETEGEDVASVRIRTAVDRGGPGPSETIAISSPGRSSGFPRMVRVGSDLIFAWTDVTGPESRVRVSTARVGGLDGESGGLRTAAETEQVGEMADFEPLNLPAPDYSAPDLEGNPVDLAEMRGEVVLLNVWATWCAPCRVEMPDLQRLHDEFSGDGLRVIGVSIDGPRSEAMIERFLGELEIDFMILRDPEDRISGILSAHAVPLTILIDREGRMQWRHLGPVTSDDPVLRAVLAAAL
ncbi:MAG: hypothetical protein EA351_12105 [Gemmatimonadales bacterium]|nr:MAG: hypothetical protein EA351_12105 [Gemmatimonadales bacterium]